MVKQTRQTLMRKIKEIQAAYENVFERNGIPIPMPVVRDGEVSDDTLRSAVLTMRKHTDWSAEHPDEEDPYETRDKEWQGALENLTRLSDWKGIKLS